MDPNPVSSNNLLKTKKIANYRRCSNDYSHYNSELYSSFTDSNSIYDSACNGDGSITINDSLASSRTYSTCCSGTTASTSTTSTLIADGINTLCKDESLTLTEDSCSSTFLIVPDSKVDILQSKLFANHHDKYATKILSFDRPKQNTNKEDRTNESTARSNTTYHASSRLDLSQRL